MKPSFMQQLQSIAPPAKTLVDRLAPYHEKSFSQKLAMATDKPESNPSEQQQLDLEQKQLDMRKAQIELQNKEKDLIDTKSELDQQAKVDQLQQQHQIQAMAQNPGQVMPMQVSASGPKMCALQAVLWRRLGLITE